MQVLGLDIADIAIIAQVASAVVVAITVPLIVKQIREQTKFRKLEAYNHLYDTLASNESREARRLVYASREIIDRTPYSRLQNENPALAFAIGRVTSDYEHIGRLVDKKDIEQEFAYRTYGADAFDLNKLLKRYTSTDETAIGERLPWHVSRYYYFRKFAEDSEHWLNRHSESGK